MTKDAMLKALSEFFVSKGVDTMSLVEYRSYGNEVPVRDLYLRRYHGNWARVLNNVGKRYPIVIEKKVEEVKPKKAAPKKVEKDVE